MKGFRLVFGLGFLILAGIYSYAEENSGVLVFDSSLESGKKEAVKDEAGQGEVFESRGPARGASQISGRRISDVVVSKAVTIDEDWVISYVDTPMGVGFTLVRVGKDGMERQVLEIDSPMMAVGKGFPAGTYKVYPNKSGGFEEGEMLINVYYEPKKQAGGLR
jgi:hypothetical protein